MPDRTYCPEGCGKLFVNKEYALKHVEKDHKIQGEMKKCGWATPFGFVDFTHPVSYNEAYEAMKEMQNSFWDKKDDK